MTTAAPMPLPDVALRIATADDALCLGVLGLQVFLDTYATAGIRPSLAREALRGLAPDAIAASIARPAATFVVAETDGHLVGFAQLRARAPHALVPDPAATELERLYVQRNFLGRGVGARLLAHAEDLARAAGAPVLWLTAWIGNVRALRFYARQGYEEIGATQFEFEGERHENRLFRRTLRATGSPHDVAGEDAC